MASNRSPTTISKAAGTGYRLHCAAKARQLHESGFGHLHGGTVSYLLYGKANQEIERCWCITRILNSKGHMIWTEAAVAEAYRLEQKPDEELRILDPHKAKPVELTDLGTLGKMQGIAQQIQAKKTGAYH